jgi:pilus assembly protein CpaF
MFGKRGAPEELTRPTPPRQAATPASVAADKPAAPKASAPPPKAATPPPQPAAASGAQAGGRLNMVPTASVAPTISVDSRSDDYYQVKTTIFSALIDTIDLAPASSTSIWRARKIRDIVNETPISR